MLFKRYRKNGYKLMLRWKTK